jgi:hypothetical protein
LAAPFVRESANDDEMLRALHDLASVLRQPPFTGLVRLSNKEAGELTSRSIKSSEIRTISGAIEIALAASATSGSPRFTFAKKDTTACGKTG